MLGNKLTACESSKGSDFPRVNSRAHGCPRVELRAHERPRVEPGGPECPRVELRALSVCVGGASVLERSQGPRVSQSGAEDP